MLRSMSLLSGVTPRRLNQVVLPDPGSPMARTTTPLGARGALFGGCPVASDAGAGGDVGDWGCISMWILGARSSGPVSAWASSCRYEGCNALWPGFSGWPTLPVDSDSCVEAAFFGLL